MIHLCELCGEPMPTGETMFKYHGFSGPCPTKQAAEVERAEQGTRSVEPPSGEVRGREIVERLHTLTSEYARVVYLAGCQQLELAESPECQHAKIALEECWDAVFKASLRSSAERERMREALEDIEGKCADAIAGRINYRAGDLQIIARAALKRGTGEGE